MKKTNKDRGGVWHLLAGTLVVSLGLLSNLGSTGYRPDPECAAGTESYETAGDTQTGAASAPLGGGLRVKFSCVIANPPQPTLPPRTVTWAVNSGGGLVNGKTTVTVVTDQFGVSEVQWSLGALQGMQTVSATVADKTLTFNAKAGLPTVGGNCTSGPGTTFENTRIIAGAETWTLAGSPYRATAVLVNEGVTLTIDPGVTVCLRNELSLRAGARLLANGKKGEEIRLTVADLARDSWRMSLGLDFQPNTPGSELRYVQADNLAGLSVYHTSVQMEDSRFVIDPTWRANNECALVVFTSVDTLPATAPSNVRRTVFDGYGGSLPPFCDAGVRFDSGLAPVGGPSIFEARVRNAPGDAVRVTSVSGVPAWTLQNCEITKNGRDGVVFDNTTINNPNNLGPNPGATVTACSITQNVGLGINNKRAATYTVNARGNWWGDAAGPGGPAGDGVSAGVDASSLLAVPPNLGY